MITVPRRSVYRRVKMEDFVRHLIPVLARLDGLIQTVRHQFVHKLVVMVVIAQDLISAAVLQIGKGMIAVHQFVSKNAKMEGFVLLQILVSVLQIGVDLIVLNLYATKVTLRHSMKGTKVRSHLRTSGLNIDHAILALGVLLQMLLNAVRKKC